MSLANTPPNSGHSEVAQCCRMPGLGVSPYIKDVLTLGHKSQGLSAGRPVRGQTPVPAGGLFSLWGPLISSNLRSSGPLSARVLGSHLLYTAPA